VTDGVGSLRAIDANVILRYLLADVADQFERARELIDSDDRLGLTVVALAEVAWTLSGPLHGFDRATVAQLLIDFLARENVVAVGFDGAEAQAALLTCLPDVGAAGFGDALIAASARSFGIGEIYSFDQRVARAGLTRILPGGDA
jgi:predicted nucleic acid-binding protein